MLLRLFACSMLAAFVASPAFSEAAVPPVHTRNGATSAVAGAARRDSLDVGLYARILKSADQRVLDSALIMTALESPNTEIRRVAARTVSQVALRHRRRAIPLLVRLSQDADSAVASAGIFGLGLVRDTASVPLLASVVEHRNPSASAAAWSLGEIGSPAAATIAALLASSGGPPRFARGVVRELLIAESKRRALDFAAIAPFIRSSDPELRWATAYAIARNRTPAGARALLEAVAPDAAFRAELARELTAPTVGDSLRENALARLRLLVEDNSPYVRINALHSIATFGTLARPVILHGLHDRDANVRVAAAQSSATAFDTTVAVWREAWRVDTSYKVRRSLLESAALDRVELPAENDWRVSADWRLRAAAVAAMAGSRDTARARAIALAATHDHDARVRGDAYNVLVRSDTAGRDSTVQRALLAARADPDSIVRSSIPGNRSRPLDTAVVERPIAWYENAVRTVVIPSLHGRAPRALMRTVRGQIVIELDGVLAPLTVLNYATLADSHVYDNLRFHRVVPGFVAQDGDPRGDGEGGPGYAIRDELTLLPYERGAVGMALSGPDTGGSQYFLTLTPQPHLTGHYTVFGHVTSGFDVMDALVEGDAIHSISVHL